MYHKHTHILLVLGSILLILLQKISKYLATSAVPDVAEIRHGGITSLRVWIIQITELKLTLFRERDQSETKARPKYDEPFQTHIQFCLIVNFFFLSVAVTQLIARKKYILERLGSGNKHVFLIY